MENVCELLFVQADEAARSDNVNVEHYLRSLLDDIKEGMLPNYGDVLYRLAQDYSVAELAGDVQITEIIKLIVRYL